MKVRNVLIGQRNSNHLGYSAWLVTDRPGDVGEIKVDGVTLNCHPAIRASRTHSSALGVAPGECIAGVRWPWPGDHGIRGIHLINLDHNDPASIKRVVEFIAEKLKTDPATLNRAAHLAESAARQGMFADISTDRTGVEAVRVIPFKPATPAESKEIQA